MVARIAKRLLFSCLMFFGLMAMGNFDALFLHRPPDPELAHRNQLRQVRAHLERQIPQTSAQLTDLKNAFASDEIGDANPFANLSTLEPLQRIIARGVTSFSRQAFRSPEHRAEFGYDLLLYEIHHTDGSTSTVMAYLEPELDGRREPVVILQSPLSPGVQQSLYRAGHLIEQGTVPETSAQTLVARHVNAGIPFFSLAR